MANTASIGIHITPQQINDAVRRMKRSERTAFVEDLIAAASPDYLDSIREAREDYKKGRVYTHNEVFKRK
ncbi:MAG: hypothetical protein FJ217_14725 [Ignavibacteria bacterium]|nr:hypothetical protein [Ignavibacteria bacterium]